MPFIVHHNDDDGRCAGFIMKQHINHLNPMIVLNPKDFVEYNYNSDLMKKLDNVNNNDIVYIVDISLSEPVLEFVNAVIELKNCLVVHIDHHKTGIDYYEEHKDEIIDSDKYIPFMKNGISGAMLSWIYADIMNEEDRNHPNDVKFEFDDDNLRTRCCRVDNDGNPIDKDDIQISIERLITPVPDVLRFIDDNDIWKHKINETKPFTNGFYLVENKHPLAQVWVDLFDQSDAKEQAEFIENIINNGTVILSYRDMMDAKNLYNGFYISIEGISVCCLNVIGGNSSIFQDLYEYSDAVCKFSFDGEKWWYTFYSNDEGADCSVIVKHLANVFGESHGVISFGGHVHAAGCTYKKNIFEEFVCDKSSFVEKRKQIRIDKEIAAEQARIKAEEEKLRKDAEKLAALKAKIAAQIEDEDYGF